MKTTKLSLALAIIGSVLITGRLSAYNLSHGPFPDEDGVKKIRIVEMAKTNEHLDTGKVMFSRFTVPNEPATQLMVFSKDEVLEIELVNGSNTLFPRTSFSHFSFEAGISAESADLNGDGKRDFLTYSYSGGCGLAAGYCDIAFLLSGRDGYRLTTVTTLWPNPGNFLVLGGKPCFIHTYFSGVEECKDGKSHNFWTYNILVIDGATMRLGNSLVPGFPKTVFYSFKPNHKETTLLTAKQKSELAIESRKEVIKTK
jgi:hypothetical protein